MGYKIHKIRLGTQQVRPYRFNPTSDTLAYYPLNGDIKDYSGNGYNGTWAVGTETYNTLASGLKVAQFSTAGSEVTTTFNGKPKYASVYVYKSSQLGDAGVDDWKQIVGQNSYDNGPGWLFRMANTGNFLNKIAYQNGNGSANAIYKTENYKDKWYLLSATTSGSSTLFYVNGEYIGSLNSAISSSRSLWMGTAPRNTSQTRWTLYGYLSDLILENKTWTQAEIQDYYNKSKGYYGL